MAYRVAAWRVWFVFSLVVVALCASCAPTRYESFKPPGAEQPWAIKADKSLGGTVTITINGVPAIQGQVPIFGSKEVDGEFEGRKIKLALTKEISTAQGDLGNRAIFMVDGVVASRFSW